MEDLQRQIDELRASHETLLELHESLSHLVGSIIEKVAELDKSSK